MSVVSGIIGFIFAFLSDFYFKRWEDKRNIFQEAPYINICTIRKQAITGKKRKRNYNSIEIELGNFHQEFRYVYAKIVNVGKSTITNCTIEKTNILNQLNPQDEFPITFLIFEPLKPNSRRTYSFQYQIEDGKGNKYKGTYSLKVNIDKREAIFLVKRKQREV